MTQYSFIDLSGEVRLTGTIDPAPGGGSQPGAVRTLTFPFEATTPNLADGVPVWTPAAGDYLLDAWFEIDTVFDKDGGIEVVPSADIGLIADAAWVNTGLFYNIYGPIALTDVAPDSDSTGWYAPLARGTGNSDAFPQSLAMAATYYAAHNGGTAFECMVPLRFLGTDPLMLVVSADSLPGGSPIDATSGAARLMIQVCTPDTA